MIYLSILASAITTCFVVWAHIGAFILWEQWQARRKEKYFSKRNYQKETWLDALPIEQQDTGGIYDPFSDVQTLNELLKHEVGQRAKKCVYMPGLTITGEHRIAEEIQQLKRRNSVRLRPLSE